MTLDKFIRQVQEKLVKSETYTEHGKECDLETAIVALIIATQSLNYSLNASEPEARMNIRVALAKIDKLLETSKNDHR